MKQPYKTLFGILCWLPAIAIVAYAAWNVNHPLIDQLTTERGLRHLRDVPVSWWVVAGLTLGVTVLAQLGLAAWVGLYCDKRPDMPQLHKILWPVGVAFVGSVFAPLFFFKKVRGYSEGAGDAQVQRQLVG